MAKIASKADVDDAITRADQVIEHLYLYVAPKTGLRACRTCRRAHRRASDNRKRKD